MRAALTAFAFAVALGGCAENAILELQVELPPAPDDGTTDPWFARIQVRRAIGFETVWMGADPRSVQLGDAPQTDCISVQSSDPSIDVQVRIRYCRDENCLGFGDDSAPEHRFELEHPFYIGRRTYWFTRIDRVPRCASDADCDVGRCFDGVCGCEVDSDCCPTGGCTNTSFSCLASGCVREVGRCDIEGCVSGEGRLTNFCSGEDGRHFCETNGYDRLEAYMCSLP